MRIYPLDDGKAAFVRLERGLDLLSELNEAAATLAIQAGAVQIIGAVEQLAVAYYWQDAKEFAPHHYSGPCEIASGVGNVSLKNGRPVVHIHVTGSGANGKAVGGHLIRVPGVPDRGLLPPARWARARAKARGGLRTLGLGIVRLASWRRPP
jgi:predicted DNA-binding protein with PD1-like motif